METSAVGLIKKLTTQLSQAMAAMEQVLQSMIMALNIGKATDNFFPALPLVVSNNYLMSIVASLVVGIDGATTRDCRSAGVSSLADRKVFLQRRREFDCIIIGGNTARHEPYNKTPVPLIVISRSLVNPVQGNHLAHFWNCSPAEAVAKARKLFGENILIEGGITMINELIENNILDQLELSVTPATGGENLIDWKALLGKFKTFNLRQADGTQFYSASN